MSNQKLKPISKVGKFYHFFDDGKLSPGRHYICKVEQVVKYDDARDIIKDISVWDNNGAYHKENNTLIECWLNEKKCNDWIYADITDYFVEISCPKYDKYNLWFVRTKTVVGIHWIYNMDGKEDNQILREKYIMILLNTGKKKDMTFLHIQIQNINEII